MPAERGVQRHAVKPGGCAGPALKLRQGSPDLEQDFLDQVLAILGRERIGAGHLQDGAAMLIEPALKKRFRVFIEQFRASLPEVLVALGGCFLQERCASVRAGRSLAQIQAPELSSLRGLPHIAAGNPARRP